MVKSIGLQILTHSLRVNRPAVYLLVDLRDVLWAHSENDVEVVQGFTRQVELLVGVPCGWVCRQFPSHDGARIALAPGRPRVPMGALLQQHTEWEKPIYK